MSRLIELPGLATAMEFLQRFLFGSPGRGGGEPLTRDFVRLPNPSDVAGSVLGRHLRGGNQVIVEGVH